MPIEITFSGPIEDPDRSVGTKTSTKCSKQAQPCGMPSLISYVKPMASQLTRKCIQDFYFCALINKLLSTKQPIGYAETQIKYAIKKIKQGEKNKNKNDSAYLDFHETFFPSVNLTEFF